MQLTKTIEKRTGIILASDDKKLISLAQVKPMILRPGFENQRLGYDNLKEEIRVESQKLYAGQKTLTR
jgi:hypothetical protein